MKPVRIGLILVAAGLLVGCTSQVQTTTSPPTNSVTPDEPTQSSSPASTAAPFGSFAVDGERKLFIQCMGSGSPTILMEAGGGDGSLAWPRSMFAGLAEQTMVCAYDRAGTGRSDPAPEEPRSAVDVQSDLEALLEAAGIAPPYLLVGQSFGGGVALYHALQHPEDVAGMVIVDPGWPSSDPAKDPMRAALTEEQWAEFMGDGEDWDDAGNTEHIDFEQFTAEIEQSVRPLPGVPIRILSATQASGCPAEWDCALMIERSIEFQKQWLELSPDAVQVLVEGGHNLHEDNPEAVTSEIQRVLDESRP